MNRTVASILGLALLLVLFFGINILAKASLRSARLDLTDNKLYTISDGSRNIASGVDEPVRLRLYYSRSLAAGRPGLQNYAERVRELLDEFVRRADGKLLLEIIDPAPFSEAEDEAVQAGLLGVPVSGDDNFYLGLVGTNAVDGRETIRFFEPSQEQFLEYEVSRLIYSLAHPERPVIGVLSTLPLGGTPPNPMQPQPQPPWQIIAELRALFEVRMLNPAASDIDDDIDVLLIIHPQTVTDLTTYAIDQYVLAGGNAVVFVDPNCESQPLPPGAQQNPMAAFEMDRSSNLQTLFNAWGLQMDPAKVAGDLEFAMPVVMGGQAGGRRDTVSFIGWLALKDDAIKADDAVTGRLKTINVATSGFFTNTADEATCLPLLQTSSESMAVDATKFKFMPDPKDLLAAFQPRGEPFVLGVRLTRSVSSAFPAGPPAEVDEAAKAAHRAESDGPINVLVFADVDMLADRFWLREETLFGQIRLGYRKLADNGDLLVNAMDNMAGSSDLISIRARGQFARTFTRVEEIRKEAEQEYRDTEKQLQDKLRETEQKINEIQQGRTDVQEGSTLILTPEQQAELERFRTARTDTRRELRAVQHNLRKDIELLGTRLKVINIVLVPVIVILLAVSLALFRAVRRRG